MPDVLVDASALIALLDRGDAQHERCVKALEGIRDPLATVWPAVAEAMHLLSDTPKAPGELCDLVSEGGVRLIDLDATDFGRMKELMAKYHDLPMDFADAALVRAAERDRLNSVLTFDRDFHVYRLPRRGRFKVLP